MPRPDDSTPLGEARIWLGGQLEYGTTCPCCTQFAKRYDRKITAGIAKVLITMHRRSGNDWVYLPGIRSAGQDEVIARHWGLIERHPDEKRPDGSSRVGWWRLTPHGTDYVLGLRKIPMYARLFNGRLFDLKLHGPYASIRDALGTKFDYDDLMRGV